MGVKCIHILTSPARENRWERVHSITFFSSRKKKVEESCATGANTVRQSAHEMTVVHTFVCNINQCVLLCMSTSSAEFDVHGMNQRFESLVRHGSAKACPRKSSATHDLVTINNALQSVWMRGRHAYRQSSRGQVTSNVAVDFDQDVGRGPRPIRCHHLSTQNFGRLSLDSSTPHAYVHRNKVDSLRRKRPTHRDALPDSRWQVNDD